MNLKLKFKFEMTVKFLNTRHRQEKNLCSVKNKSFSSSLSYFSAQLHQQFIIFIPPSLLKALMNGENILYYALHLKLNKKIERMRKFSIC